MVRICKDEQCTLLISGSLPASGEMSKKMVNKIVCVITLTKSTSSTPRMPQGL